MPTYTIFSNITDNILTSGDAVYLSARAGTGTGIPTVVPPGVELGTVTNNNAAIRNTFFPAFKLTPAYYYISEVFMDWDTSSIPTTDTVTSVALSLYGSGGKAGANFTVEAYPKNWGVAVDAGDWVAGASIGALGLVASFVAGTSDPASNWSSSAYNTFTENGTAFKTAIVKGGTTKLLFCLDTLRSATAPTGLDNVSTFMADQGGTTTDPKLVVTTTSGGNFFNLF